MSSEPDNPYIGRNDPRMFEPIGPAKWRSWDEAKEMVKAAEVARAQLADLQARLTAETRRREEAAKRCDEMIALFDEVEEQRDAAQREVARLREALAEIANADVVQSDGLMLRKIARATLAVTPTTTTTTETKKGGG